MNPIAQVFVTAIVGALLTDFSTFAAAQKADPFAEFEWKPFATKLAIALCTATLVALGSPVPQG